MADGFSLTALSVLDFRLPTSFTKKRVKMSTEELISNLVTLTLWLKLSNSETMLMRVLRFVNLLVASVLDQMVSLDIMFRLLEISKMTMIDVICYIIQILNGFL